MTRRREPEKGVVELFENVINTFLENEDLSELYFSMGNMEIRYQRKNSSGIVIGFSDPAKIKEDRKKWKASHPEYVRAKQKEYVSRHRERLLAFSRDYYRKRIAEMRATGKYEAYLESHRKQARERSAKKKAAKALAGLMQASQDGSQNNQAHTE